MMSEHQLEIARKYRERNRIRLRENAKRCYQKNRYKYRENALRRYRQTMMDPEGGKKLRQKRKEYRERNEERFRRYREKNRDKYNQKAKKFVIIKSFLF